MDDDYRKFQPLGTLGRVLGPGFGVLLVVYFALRFFGWLVGWR
jgi:hypothetical protein